MRDLGHDAAAAVTGGGTGTVLRPEDVRTWTAQLASGRGALNDDERIELIRAFEELKCASEAAQAVESVEFDKSQRAKAAVRGVPKDRQGRGIAGQVALARRTSPWWGERLLQLAKVLATELPHTMAAFQAGRISERRARIVARETACMSLEHRMQIDEELAEDFERIEAMGDQELAGAIRDRAYALDPRSFVERRTKAESERRVTSRPAPDVMAYVTALLPIKDAIAVHAALHREWQRLNLAGDPRTKGQIMADTLVQRVVNPELAHADGGRGVGLMVNLVVSDTVLFGDEDGAGYAEGFGGVPGDLIREWIAENLENGVPTFIRRLYETPATGDLVAMDSKATHFAGKLAEFLRLRDQTCRTPHCDAPVKHLDHSVKKAHGGPTDAANGQGLCECCNYNKEAIGWSAQPRPGPRHTIETVTPTGHVYRSMARRLGPERKPRWKLHREGVYRLAG